MTHLFEPVLFIHIFGLIMLLAIYLKERKVK